MKKAKVSVIVPVYNVEKYLKKCLLSLVNQTYKNLEIIVVNDCSPDNSEKIIKEFCLKYENIKYIKNKKNRGLSYSRNMALKESTGDYIGYVDSDDYVDINYYESLVNTLEKTKSDIAVCDINVVYEENNTSNRCICGSKNNKKIEFINNGLAASACNKLFKKEIISKYKFEEGKINEDIAVIIPSIISANKVSYDDNVVYNYIQRDNSIQNSSITDKRFDIFYGVEQTLKRIEKDKNFEEYKDVIIYNQLIMLLIYVLPKEPSIIRRSKLFKKFNKLSKKYKIRKNKYLWQFLSNQGRKHKYYYKLLLKLNCNNLSFLASLLVEFYNIFKKIFVKRVIKENITMDDLIKMAIRQSKMKSGKDISVVVPNYNYKEFLFQRIYSILYQKIKINEIIILDDCSRDNSRETIDEIVANIGKYINVRKIYNEKNSGKAFIQWEKGFNESSGDYVWIAEADDYCSNKFLSAVMKNINDDTIIAYTDTAFINKTGDLILKTISKEIDVMNTKHWNKSYTNNGIDEFNSYTYLNCTIANVSSAVIKKADYSREFELAKQYSQAGDWIFYAQLMHKGNITYLNKAYNYYRVHGENVSSVTKKDSHFKEIQNIHQKYDEMYGLNEKQKEEILKRYAFLRKVWNLSKE